MRLKTSSRSRRRRYLLGNRFETTRGRRNASIATHVLVVRSQQPCEVNETAGRHTSCSWFRRDQPNGAGVRVWTLAEPGTRAARIGDVGAPVALVVDAAGCRLETARGQRLASFDGESECSLLGTEETAIVVGFAGGQIAVWNELAVTRVSSSIGRVEVGHGLAAALEDEA